MKYFELATQPDTEPYFAQFTDDAVVEDEGRERHGIAEIRAWRTEVPPVAYAVKHVDRRVTWRTPPSRFPVTSRAAR